MNMKDMLKNKCYCLSFKKGLFVKLFIISLTRSHNAV